MNVCTHIEFCFANKLVQSNTSTFDVPIGKKMQQTYFFSYYYHLTNIHLTNIHKKISTG